MSIKSIEISNLSSFDKFNFDITKDGNVNKNVLIFGTNGSGKSSLATLIQKLDKYCSLKSPENLENLKEYLSSKFSKESETDEITIDMKFDNYSKNFLFNKSTSTLKINGEEWEKVKVFNEDYTNATIGKKIDIDFKENGLIIGETNKDLEKERVKQKSITEELKKINLEIDSFVEVYKNEFISVANTSTDTYLKKITKELFLEKTCLFNKNMLLIEKRNLLGNSSQKQLSTNIDISKLDNFFDIDYWEKLFSEEIIKPDLPNEYKKLLLKYSDFYKVGMIIKEDELENKCPYCLQSWNDKNKVFENFEKYLTSEYNSKKEEINLLYKKIDDYVDLLNEINKKIEIQKNIVEEECKKYGVDFKNYTVVNIDDSKFNSLKELIKNKINTMEKPFSVSNEINELLQYYKLLFSNPHDILNGISTAISKRTSKVRELNTKLSEHYMKVFWEDKKDKRDKYYKLKDILDISSDKIKELEEKNEDINTIQEVFNGLLKFIGLDEYYLNSENKLQLKIETLYDISSEGLRISTAQRKILSLCYFFAEIVSEVSKESELKKYTVIYDDPVDSADYIFFHGITSLIENIENILAKILKKEKIIIGQHIVFTHNSLLYNRLTQNFSFHKKMIKKNQKTTLKNADKIENNYKLYIEAISEFYKKEETSQKDKILIGNLIRRVLEIVISFNELNSNNVSIVKDYGKPTLGLIANHLSHENFSKVLTPLPTDDEMKKACKELFEVIEELHPKQFEYINKNFLN